MARCGSLWNEPGAYLACTEEESTEAVLLKRLVVQSDVKGLDHRMPHAGIVLGLLAYQLGEAAQEVAVSWQRYKRGPLNLSLFCLVFRIQVE